MGDRGYETDTIEVRAMYCRAAPEWFGSADPKISGPEFDRWLAVHDAERGVRISKLEGIIREARSYFGANETAYVAKVLDSAFTNYDVEESVMDSAGDIRKRVLDAVDFWLDNEDFRDDMALDERQRNEAIEIVADEIRKAVNLGRN